MGPTWYGKAHILNLFDGGIFSFLLIEHGNGIYIGAQEWNW